MARPPFRGQMRSSTRDCDKVAVAMRAHAFAKRLHTAAIHCVSRCDSIPSNGNFHVTFRSRFLTREAKTTTRSSRAKFSKFRGNSARAFRALDRRRVREAASSRYQRFDIDDTARRVAHENLISVLLLPSYRAIPSPE